MNKTILIKRMAQLVNDKEIEDIADIRDESDRDGYRVVYDLKKDAIPNIVLNNLFKYTQLQSTFGVIMLALCPDSHTGRLVPKVMGLKDVLVQYIEHRHDVIVRGLGEVHACGTGRGCRARPEPGGLIAETSCGHR